MTDDTHDLLGAREELTLALLGGYLHDVGSPLAALTSNLSVARDIAQSLPDPAHPAAVELREVIDDLEAATARLTEMAADLRGYTGMPGGHGTAHDLARIALRLARAHVSRRATTVLEIDPSLRPGGPPGWLARSIGETLVAVTKDLPGTGARERRITISSEQAAIVLRISPAPERDLSPDLGAVFARLRGAELELSREADTLEVRIPVSWT